MLLLQAGSPELGPLFQIDFCALGSEDVVLVPAAEASLQRIILLSACDDHQERVILAAGLESTDFLEAFLDLRLLAHHFRHQNFPLHFAQCSIIRIA